MHVMEPLTETWNFFIIYVFRFDISYAYELCSERKYRFQQTQKKILKSENNAKVIIFHKRVYTDLEPIWTKTHSGRIDSGKYL